MANEAKIKELGLRLQNAQRRLSQLKAEGASQDRIDTVDGQVRRAQAALLKVREEGRPVPERITGPMGNKQLSGNEAMDYTRSRAKEAAARKQTRKNIMRGQNFVAGAQRQGHAGWKNMSKGAGEANAKYFEKQDARKAALDKMMKDKKVK